MSLVELPLSCEGLARSSLNGFNDVFTEKIREGSGKHCMKLFTEGNYEERNYRTV